MRALRKYDLGYSSACEMCIRCLVQYACGHAEKELMNRHCQCALIVGLVREVEVRCGRGECGGGPPRECDEGRVEVKRESEGRRDAQVENETDKVGM
jgi:hypothetical protein